MICLADNDYILKLAACDLLEEMQTLFGAERNEIYVLPSAKFKFKRDTKKQLYDQHSVPGSPLRNRMWRQHCKAMWTICNGEQED